MESASGSLTMTCVGMCLGVTFLITAGAALTLVNSGFTIGGVGLHIPYVSRWETMALSPFSAALVTVSYGLYFLVTYTVSRRIPRLCCL